VQKDYAIKTSHRVRNKKKKLYESRTMSGNIRKGLKREMDAQPARAQEFCMALLPEKK